MVELFADLPPDHEFFQQFSFIASDDLPDYKDLLLRSRPDAPDQLPEADRVRLMSLPFKLVLARHRLGHFDASAREAILRAREIFDRTLRSEEHTSELQSLMLNSYAVFCLNKKKNDQQQQYSIQ